MMEVFGKGNEVWELDEGLRNTAQELLGKFPDELGHVELDRVIFVRANGVKIPASGTTWYGKCYLIRVPIKIISHFVLVKLGQAGLLDPTEMSSHGLGNLLDLSYLIAINTDAIENEGGPIDKIEEITLHHEMLHISDDMEKLVKHDVQDFGSILHRYGPYWAQGVIEEKEKKAEVVCLDNFLDKLKATGGQVVKSFEESE
jgi:hypothetical protein